MTEPDTQPIVPHWNGKPITEGWWWLQFSGGPGPRYWDGTFWDRGSIFVAAEDYADNPILGRAIPPTDMPSDMVEAGCAVLSEKVAEAHQPSWRELVTRLYLTMKALDHD